MNLIQRIKALAVRETTVALIKVSAEMMVTGQPDIDGLSEATADVIKAAFMAGYQAALSGSNLTGEGSLVEMHEYINAVTRAGN